MNSILLRTLALAAHGGAATHPNPNVGAVLATADGVVLAEGWHARFGGPHAEVDALAKWGKPVPEGAVLYVSLEPCVWYPGKKQPACSTAIVAAGIKRVVIGFADPNPKAGGGAAWLREQGVEVVFADDPAPYQAAIKPFLVNQQHQRPYLVLKWAETTDGKLGWAHPEQGQLPISGDWALRYGHSLRTRCQAVLVGWRTVLQDNPQLNNRLHPDPWQPVRIVLDRAAQLRQHSHLHLLEDALTTWLLTSEAGLPQSWRQVPVDVWDDPAALLHWLYQQSIGSVLVEGGAQTHQRLLNAGLWDEVHILRSEQAAPTGATVAAPALPASVQRQLKAVQAHGSDRLFVALRT